MRSAPRSSLSNTTNKRSKRDKRESDRICCTKDTTPGIECSMNTSFGNGDSLLPTPEEPRPVVLTARGAIYLFDFCVTKNGWSYGS
ncbi:hypothetical protein THRCLA_21723 [Thraustotheca clavata]|uniref:Uncharacterized protein n=1 Tax=Thraustotheca clavata TaxID=74557 RepID=A0A1V9ZQE6_9STRA|nr:hypothetical protein THRCLA_21723 [Thraustotheca clavata]